MDAFLLLRRLTPSCFAFFALLALVASAQSIGDTPEQVIAKVGAPSAKRASGDRETWIYSGNRKLVFVEGKLAEIGASFSAAAEPSVPSGNRGTSASSPSSSSASGRSLSQKVSADAMLRSLQQDILLVGTTKIPMMYIFLGLAGFIAVVYAGLNSLGQDYKKLGAAILACITLLYLVANLGAALAVFLLVPDDVAKQLGPMLESIQMRTVVRAVFVTVQLYFIWRGSGWAFGLFVVTAVAGITWDLWGAFTNQMWLLALPALFHCAVVAAMVCAPVQGFLSRGDKSVKQVVDEMNRKSLAAKNAAARNAAAKK